MAPVKQEQKRVHRAKMMDLKAFFAIKKENDMLMGIILGITLSYVVLVVYLNKKSKNS